MQRSLATGRRTAARTPARPRRPCWCAGAAAVAWLALRSEALLVSARLASRATAQLSMLRRGSHRSRRRTRCWPSAQQQRSARAAALSAHSRTALTRYARPQRATKGVRCHRRLARERNAPRSSTTRARCARERQCPPLLLFASSPRRRAAARRTAGAREHGACGGVCADSACGRRTTGAGGSRSIGGALAIVTAFQRERARRPARTTPTKRRLDFSGGQSVRTA
jgi:hypothetical protein